MRRDAAPGAAGRGHRPGETGHLTFATLHTSSCVSSINRVIDVFPPYQQVQVRAQLSFVLEGVLCQQLLPRASGVGRSGSRGALVGGMVP